MSKASDKEKTEALEQLREWIKPGDTVFTILRSVSRSGMSRQIGIAVPLVGEDGRIDFVHPNWSVAKAIGARTNKAGDGVVMGGCGMDMGFALVYELSHALYRTYACLGKGKCPSNYHVNHRDRVQCHGTLVYNQEGPNLGQRCYLPRQLFSRHEIPADWPRRTIVLDGELIEVGPLSCLTDDNGEHPIVCPTCQGEGSLPNPEGPERFDLVHEDSYSLKQRWL